MLKVKAKRIDPFSNGLFALFINLPIVFSINQFVNEIKRKMGGKAGASESLTFFALNYKGLIDFFPY